MRCSKTEALVELGRFSDALPHLAGDAAAAQPRFEWVCRRLVMLQSREGRVWPAGIEVPARSERGRRLAAFWRALAQARSGDRGGLEALAGSGFPDLPAQMGGRGARPLGRGRNPVGGAACRAAATAMVRRPDGGGAGG